MSPALLQFLCDRTKLDKFSAVFFGGENEDEKFSLEVEIYYYT